MPLKLEILDNSDIRITDTDNTYIHLSPSEALALLDWLNQNKDELYKVVQQHTAAGAKEVVAVDEATIVATVRSAINDALAKAGEQSPDLTLSEKRAQLLIQVSNYPTIMPLLAHRVVTSAQLEQWLTERLSEKQAAS